jgi:1-deoxy-D-xylulose-5-phosphate reductoisomerase
VAVAAFCERRIGFTDITTTVSHVMAQHRVVSQPSLEQIFEADAWAREAARPRG